jgi:pilin isopeptide linkage protein
MKNTKKGSLMGKHSYHKGARTFLTILLSVAMVTMSVPSNAFAAAAQAATTAASTAATTAAATLSTSDEKAASGSTSTETSTATTATSGTTTTPAATTATEVDLALALDHAYIVVAGQDVVAPATKVTVTAAKDLKFTAVPDNGYRLDTVTYTQAGVTQADGSLAKTELTADANGIYTLPADVVRAGCALQVSSVEKDDSTAEATAAATLLGDGSQTVAAGAATTDGISAATATATQSTTTTSDAAAAAVAAAVATATPVATQAASGPVAITGSIADVTLKLTDASGATIDPTVPVSRDQSIHGALSIDYHPETCPNQSSLEYTYAFPSGISVDTVATSTLYDENHAVAGTYEIKDGVAHITYDKTWISDHAGSVKTFFSFDFKVEDDAVDESGSTTITFPGTGDTTIKTYKDGNVTGEKGYVLNSDGSVDFTVTFVADQDVTNFSFVDTMGKNLSFVDGSFKLDGETIAVTVDGQTVTSDVLPTLAAGSHTLTYQAVLSQAGKDRIESGKKLSGKNDTDDSTNTIGWKWGHDGTGTDNTVVESTNVLIDKSDGWLNADGTIHWHVRLNQGSPKADLGDYLFTDTLTAGEQSYVGTYVVKAIERDTDGKVVSETPVTTGDIDPAKGSFTYAFPHDAGSKEYTIEYSTKMANPSLTQTYKNTAAVNKEGVGGAKDTGQYANSVGVDGDYIEKAIVKNDASTTGLVSWRSTIHGAAIGTSDFTFWDDTDQWADNIWFAEDENGNTLAPVVSYGGEGKVLEEGVDYTLEFHKDKAGLHTTSDLHNWRFSLKFHDTEAVRQAMTGDIFVSYDTMCDGSADTYNNYSYYYIGTVKQHVAKASYQLEGTPTVTKSGSTPVWDADLGAYVTTWTIVANKSALDGNRGNADLQGTPITVTDSLPVGMHYIAGSASYVAQTAKNKTSGAVKLDPVETTADTGDTLVFSAPSAEVLQAIQQADGSQRALVTITFKAAIDSSVLTVGGTTSFTNNATAGIGGYSPSTTGTVTVEDDKVLDKTSQKNDATALIDYTVKVNEHAYDLSDEETLTFTDDLDAGTKVVRSTIKVMSGDTDITNDCVVQVDDATNVMTLILPDSTSLVVTYGVRMTGDLGSTLDVSNSATLSGKGSWSSTDEHPYTVTEATAGASGVTDTVTLYKTDSLHANRALPGAAFSLYRVSMDGHKADSSVEDDASVVDENKTTSGTAGALRFADKNTGGEAMLPNVLYYYVETAAPAGYELDATKHYVMLGDTSSDEYKAQAQRAKDYYGITLGEVAADPTQNVKDARLTTSVSLSAKKTLNNEVPAKDAYSFTLAQTSAKDSSGDDLDTGFKTRTVGNDADGGVPFGEITYDTAGTYTYTITEVVPADVTADNPTKDGVTYDLTSHEVTVTVTETAGESLTAAVTYDASTDVPVFANSYAATGSASFSATKSLDGATLAAGQFSFALEQTDEKGTVLSDGYKQTVKNGGNGAATAADVRFSDIDYTQADAGRTFYYTISEVIPEGAKDAGNGTWTNGGYTYDGHRVSVKVEVTDKGDGTLGTTRTYDDSATAPSFSNRYVASGDVTLTASKTLAGHALANDQFEFELKDASGTVLQTKTNTDQGLVTFDKITYTTAGTYHYTISEKAGELGKGYTYDAKVSNVTVTVKDNGSGKLEAVPSYDVDAEGVGTATAPTFANTYTATGSAELKATKTLTGDGATLAANQFDFQVTDSSNKVVATGTNDANGNVAFSAIKYDQADAGKTYTYMVSEVAGAAAGMSYDKTIYTATVKVSDNDDGTLSTAVTYAKVDGTEGGTALAEGGVPAFANTYAPTSTSVQLAASKVLANATDKTTLAAGEFNFQVTDASGSSVATGTNDASGNVTFSRIDLNKAGTYTYAISEVVPGEAAEAGNVANGITYDTTTYKATVVVSDQGGALKVDSVTYAKADGSALYNGATVPGFVNTYNATGSVTLGATKAFSGADAKLTADKFAFKLTSDAEGTMVISTAKNDIDGNVTFSAIGYTQEDVGKTFTYYISEVLPDGVTAESPTKDGITYDTVARVVPVTVTDAGNGRITATPTYGTTDNVTPVFTNSYAATGSIALAATKTLGGATLAAGQFTFELDQVSATDTKGKPMTTGFAPITATNDADGTVSFADVSYAQAGTYKYTISEVVPEGAKDNGDGTYVLAGVTYDKTTANVTVGVVDNGNGTLAASATYDGNKGTFSNAYKATGTTASLSATKVVENHGNADAKTLAGGDYSFTLTQTSAKDAAGEDITTGFSTKTVSNAADGSVAFGNLTYDVVGTYTYAINEVLPDGVTAESPAKDGITYDTSTHTATVTVTDDGQGQLHTTVAYDVDGAGAGTEMAPTFTNSYLSSSVDLEATKYLFGSSDTGASYSFVLTGTDEGFAPRATAAAAGYTADSTIVDDGQALTVTVQNGAFSDNQAAVTLPTITYHKAGTYCYTLAEVPNDDGTQYDDAVYRITVVVGADGVPTVTQELVSGGEQTAVDSIEFYNNGSLVLSARSMAYSAMGSQAAAATVSPQVSKVLEGGTLTDGEFSFELRDSDGRLISEGTNDARGNVAFEGAGEEAGTDQGLLKFYEEGTYTYTIDEVTGADQMVTYDDATITMVVKVTTGEDGALVATTTYQRSGEDKVTSEGVFSNKVKSIDITVRKTSKSGGEGLENATYGLWMATDDGNDVYMGHAKSDADGYITFKDVKLQNGSRYYFKEEAAPEGHLVDPYRSGYYTYRSGVDGGSPSFALDVQ